MSPHSLRTCTIGPNLDRSSALHRTGSGTEICGYGPLFSLINSSSPSSRSLYTDAVGASERRNMERTANRTPFVDGCEGGGLSAAEPLQPEKDLWKVLEPLVLLVLLVPELGEGKETGRGRRSLSVPGAVERAEGSVVVYPLAEGYAQEEVEPAEREEEPGADARKVGCGPPIALAQDMSECEPYCSSTLPRDARRACKVGIGLDVARGMLSQVEVEEHHLSCCSMMRPETVRTRVTVRR